MLFISITLSAQIDFRPGYIINKGDTVYGEIDYRGDLMMGEICRFRNAETEIQEFKPGDIESFRFIDSKYFITKEVNGKLVFLEFLISGKVCIYYLRDSEGDHYYIEKEGSPLTVLPYNEGVVNRNGVEYAFQSKQHIGILTLFMSDAPNFNSRIESIDKPEHDNLVKLAKEYHEKVCNNQECTIYERSKPGLSLKLEALSGLNYVVDKETAVPGSYLVNGILLNIWLPRVNEKLFLRTGLLLSEIRLESNKNASILRIPVQLGYIAPETRIIRPNFAIGLVAPNYTAGVMIKISKRMSAGVETWANFTSYGALFLVPYKIESYYVLGALYLNL